MYKVKQNGTEKEWEFPSLKKAVEFAKDYLCIFDYLEEGAFTAEAETSFMGYNDPEPSGYFESITLSIWTITNNTPTGKYCVAYKPLH